MIIEAFNLMHILAFTAIPGICYLALNFALKKSNEKRLRNNLLLICCFNALLYLSYKIVQARDPAYDFDIFMNLPLHFCNINLILLPLAIFTRNKHLMAYQFYFGTVLAALALVTVDPAFRSRPLFEFTSIVYFYYHSMLAVIPVMLVRFKLYTPSFKVIWQPAAVLTALTFIIHVVNIVLRTSGIAPESNYFFTYGLKGDFFTELFWRILPYEFFFLLPSLLLFAPFIFITTLPFHLSKKQSRNR
ncbi:MAG: YwaF family protein [Defluviitaleaceae bacterium]|nr:YwaF family protein [Defluviitaleaceae bacterium]MCL2835442.1 YwaF family protein [Defluviitaleaceae bacterium]